VNINFAGILQRQARCLVIQGSVPPALWAVCIHRRVPYCITYAAKRTGRVTHKNRKVHVVAYTHLLCTYHYATNMTNNDQTETKHNSSPPDCYNNLDLKLYLICTAKLAKTHNNLQGDLDGDHHKATET
jgi:hypothetical protein